jgi:hypothetical protein
MTSPSAPLIDHQFVDALFEHPAFKQRFARALSPCSQFLPALSRSCQGQGGQLSAIIEEITGLLGQTWAAQQESPCEELRNQIASLHFEIDGLKDTMAFQLSKL